MFCLTPSTSSPSTRRNDYPHTNVDRLIKDPTTRKEVQAVRSSCGLVPFVFLTRLFVFLRLNFNRCCAVAHGLARLPTALSSRTRIHLAGVQVLLENYSALKIVFKYFSATGIESGDVFNMGMLSFTELCQVCNHLRLILGFAFVTGYILVVIMVVYNRRFNAQWKHQPVRPYQHPCYSMHCRGPK